MTKEIRNALECEEKEVEHIDKMISDEDKNKKLKGMTKIDWKVLIGLVIFGMFVTLAIILRLWGVKI